MKIYKTWKKWKFGKDGIWRHKTGSFITSVWIDSRHRIWLTDNIRKSKLIIGTFKKQSTALNFVYGYFNRHPKGY